MAEITANEQVQCADKLCQALADELDNLKPLLRQMHLLSSNAVSAAARAGSEGDGFRVLTQAIQELGQEVSDIIQQTGKWLAAISNDRDGAALHSHINQLDSALSPLAISVRKGEYLATFSAVEAAHADNHGDGFNAVAVMLKQLVAALRQQVQRQLALLAELQDLKTI